MLSRGAEKLADVLTPRTEAGFSASDLARKLGVTPQSVSGWIRGKATPSPDLLVKLEDLLGIPMRAWTEEVPDEEAAQ